MVVLLLLVFGSIFVDQIQFCLFDNATKPCKKMVTLHVPCMLKAAGL